MNFSFNYKNIFNNRNCKKKESIQLIFNKLSFVYLSTTQNLQYKTQTNSPSNIDDEIMHYPKNKKKSKNKNRTERNEKSSYRLEHSITRLIKRVES